MNDSEQVIAVWGERGFRETRVRLRVYKGHTYFDVRRWAAGEGGDMVPTRKGICLNVECLDDLAQAVAQVRQQLKKNEDDHD